MSMKVNLIKEALERSILFQWEKREDLENIKSQDLALLSGQPDLVM